MIKHPAKYSDCLLPIFKKMIGECESILDPFAGTGKLKQIYPHATLLEIEPEWAAISGAIVGDATNMPFADNSFDVICTSPTYGNRMADSFIDHQEHKKYKRNTYRHAIGRPLAERNTGAKNWGPDYKKLHIEAWDECYRVLKPDGKFVLNISDHIRNGKIVPVTAWHISVLSGIGFKMFEHMKVLTRRNRLGANYNLRVEHESVILFAKGEV